METQTDNTFTWEIESFYMLQDKELHSGQFIIGDCKWRLIAYDLKVNNHGYLNLFLCLKVDDYESLPSGWRRKAKFSFHIPDYSGKFCRKQVTQQWFDRETLVRCFLRMQPKNTAYFLENELKIVVEIEVLEVIGELDTAEKTLSAKESIDVNGFQVLPSQVKSVKFLFEKHPYIASKLRIENQYMKTGYMNVLLSPIETLHQSPQEISKHDVADAYTALAYLRDAGFELDWLEEKLEEVSVKKEKEEAGVIRILEIEVELKGLKLKCSDLEAQLEKEKADVLAARAPISFSDDEDV